MNPDTPLSPREELEIRLTALLMGELSAEDAAALQKQIDGDPALADLHARLRHAMELLREASALPESPAHPVPAQLSVEKRERLLAHFKAPAPAPSVVIVKPRRDWKPYVPLGLAASLIALLGGTVFLNGFVQRKAGGLAADARMLENLRMVDSPVNQYAIESKLVGGITVVDPAESRWESQPGAIRSLNRGYVAGESNGAGTNGNHWSFTQPPPANAPTDGRTTFWSEDESTKLDVNTASEAHHWDTPARPSALFGANPAVQAPATDSLAGEKTVAANSVDFEAPERLSRSVRFVAPAPAAAPAAPPRPLLSLATKLDPVALGTMPPRDPVADNALLVPAPDGAAFSPEGKTDRFGRGEEPAGVSAGVPFAMSGRVGGVARAATASTSEVAQGLAKNTEEAVGDKASIANLSFSTGEIPAATAPSTPPAPIVAADLPALAASDPAPMPDGAKRAYFFDTTADGFGELNAPKPTPAAGPAPAAPMLPQSMLKSDAIVEGLISGALAQDAKAEKSIGANRITAGSDTYFREDTRTFAGTASLDTAAPTRANATDTDGTTARRLGLGALAQVGKDKAANGYSLRDQVRLGDDDADGDIEKKLTSSKSEERVMQQRTDEFDAGASGAGVFGGGKKPDANPLAWFGQTQAGHLTTSSSVQFPGAEDKARSLDRSAQNDPLGTKEPALRPESSFRSRAKGVKENVELALAEKPAAPTEARDLEAPVRRSLAVVPAQPQNPLEVRQGLIAGTEVRTKSKIALPAKSAAVAQKGSKSEGEAERLYKSVDELAMVPEREKKQKVNAIAARERVSGKPADVTKLALLEKQAAQKDSDDKPAAAKPAEPAPEPQAEIVTSANAFSTFSLNVSDVAFKLAAASLEKGQMPELATVRSEEFINAFDYRDPEPAGGAPLAFAAERARYPFAQNRDLLRLSVKTAAAGRQPGRALNLVLLLDNSGSMERADRVRILHEALRVLATQLQPQDKLSVVTFARTPRLWADGVAGDKAGEVTARVGEITPQGGTDLSAALDLGYATARKHFQPGSINRVVLLTDGAANLGDVNPDALKQKVETNRKQGVALDCFGIGWEGFDDTLLEALSRNGDGRYGFINSPEEAATEFAGQLAGALRVAASDVKVQVEFNPRRVTAYRQIGYAKHQLKKEQFRDNTVDAAEIGAAESGNALYAVEVNPRGEGDIATVRVRFKVPGTSDYREHEWTVPFTREAPPLEQASPALRLAGTASAFSEWLVSSQYATEVTPDRLLGLLNGVPQTFGADPRPQKLEWMIRTAKSVSGR